MVLSASSCVAFLAVACGGKTDLATVSAGETVCDRYFNAVANQARCDLPGVPPTDARLLARFNTYCMAEMSLPGDWVTAANLEACSAALESATCPKLLPLECLSFLNGTLGAGAACSLPNQCTSGECTGATPPVGDGSTRGCGVCSAIIPEGAACAPGSPDCGGDSRCVATAVDGSSGICKPVVEVGEGASCGDGATFCNSGLVCSGVTLRCTSPSPTGATCVYNADCTPGLVCMGRVCSAPVAVGAACSAYLTCAAGNGCQAGVCAPITWAGSGEPCNPTESPFCLVGQCPTDGTGVCPVVIPDGQPCEGISATRVCDSYASCVDGVCEVPTSFACE